LHLLTEGTLSPHKLEGDIGDAGRAVHLRRLYTAHALATASPTLKTSHEPHRALSGLPESSFDTAAFYKSILNTNCEAVIGYVPLPVGVVGPLLLDGKEYRVPLATTEGALVASTNRGCTAIRLAGGATSVLQADGMTRAPLVRLSSLKEASDLRAWLEVPDNYDTVAKAFNSTTRFGKLKSCHATVAGRSVYLRFKAFTGDAMGMNMVTKGVNEALKAISLAFPSLRVQALSGNMCTDKKPSAINWIQGRGKSVAAEVRLSGHVLRTVLKTSAEALAELNVNKNLVGSALAGSLGGFNAHASNVVTALYLATGQDPAQNVESSTCLTLIEVDHTIRDEADPEGKMGPGVVMTVTMPSVECATVGGGTSLPAQAACLELLGLRGSNAARAGANAEQFARVVAGTVLAGELSLMSALTTNDLLNSHMKLNRKPSEAAGGAGHVGALITPAMSARLAELGEGGRTAAAGVRYTTQYHAAGASSRAVHHHAVPGGAPAGAHGHPLAMTGTHPHPSVASSSVSPGRRFFASPATTRRLGSPTTMAEGPPGSTQFRAATLGFAAQAEAGAHGEEEPVLSVP
jgi:hydroxymethylglutaryl-CoA reductase (NADPH)